MTTGQAVSIREVMGPLPKQEQALDAIYDAKYVLYGGAAGPGKSYWLRWAAVHFLIECGMAGHRGVRVGLFCEDYPTLRDRQISRIKREFPAWLGTVRDTRDDGLGFHLEPRWGGGFIALRNLDDPAKYASTEFAAEFVDELTKNDRQTFDDLRFRLRWPGIDHTPFVAATNPGSIGHAWVKKLWVDRDFSGDDAALDPEDFAFIQALPRDNPHLGPSYWAQLDSLPERMRRALRDGHWDVFAGQVFSEWRGDVHTCKPFDIPKDWPKWTATDYGYVAPRCTLWLARDRENRRTYVYREQYETGVPAKEQASRIRFASAGENVSAHFGDPSMWQRREDDKGGTSLAEEYAKGGVHLSRANNQRITGKNYVHDSLRWCDERGVQTQEPELQVFSTCTNLIRTLPVLPYDEVRIEDVDTDAEDHAYDALRYGLGAWHAGLAIVRLPKRDITGRALAKVAV